MGQQAYPIRSYQNLRAYQYAFMLASDLFWITRRFPKAELLALTDLLRRTARSIPFHVVQCWKKRYHAPGFRHHLDEAQSACSRLGLWLHMAHDRCYLTDTEHEHLQQRKTRLQRMLTRLNTQRIPMLAGGGALHLS